jgi:hypothetical protein
MRSKERIARLEALVRKLVWALARQGTAEDGNYGFDSFGKEMRDILGELDRKQ